MSSDAGAVLFFPCLAVDDEASRPVNVRTSSPSNPCLASEPLQHSAREKPTANWLYRVMGP